MKVTFDIPDELYRQFKRTTLNNEQDETAAIIQLVRNYVHIFSDAQPSQVFISQKEKSTKSPPKTPRTQVSPPPKITCNTQKQNFIKWFKKQKYNGNPYKQTTINGYADRLESGLLDPIFQNVSVKNLFEITNLYYFRQIRLEIENCPDYKKYEQITHNGFRSAMNKYEEYLKSKS